ncbi:MAG: hypothetical protein ACOYMN_20600, partial [Roseimicrobium sp.]
MLEDNAASALTATLKRRAADLVKIPEARHVEVARLITTVIPAAKLPATLDPELKKALEPLMAAEFKAQENRLDAWLKAARARDLNLNDESYETELIRLVGELAQRDRAKARELFLHASTLMEAKETQEGWNTSNAGNGWLLRSYVLEQIVDNVAKMEVLALSMQLYHEDTTGSLTMSGWSNTAKWGAALLDVWKNGGGQGNNARGLQTMVERTRKELGDTPTTLLAVAFYDFFAKLAPNLRVPALMWSEKPPQDASLAAVVKELNLAGRFFLATDGSMRSNAGAQKALKDLGGLAPVWEDAAQMLSNEKLNPRVRLALAHHFCYHAPLEVTPSVAAAGESLALKALQQGHCVHGYQHGWIIQAFCRLPTTDAWKATAQAHWEAWITRTSATPRSSTLRYSPCDWALHNMIRLSGRAGQEEWIARLLSLYERTLSNEPSALAVLVASGRPKEATDWLKKNWKKSIYDPEKGLHWDADIAAGLPAFREACGSPDFALLGEIMLALLPDLPKPDQGAIPGFLDRSKRLVALAKKLPGTNFATADVRTRCLEYLGQEYETYEPLAKEFDEAAAHTDIAAITAMDNTWMHWHKFKPLRASISRKAWAGDVRPAIEAYDKVLAAGNPDSSDKRSAVKEVGWDPIWAVPWKLARTETPDWQPLLTFVEHVLAKTPANLQSDHIGDAVSLKLLIHHALGKPGAIADWRKGLSTDAAHSLEKQFTQRFELWNLVHHYGGLPKARISVEQRAALVASLVKDEWVVRRYPDAGTNLPNLMAALISKAKVFTADELAAAWKPIAEAFPRKGRTAAEAADLLAQNGKMPDA